MDKLIREYLETAYDSPFDVNVKRRREDVDIEVYCKGDCIARGTINKGKDWTYISWTIPIDTWNKMFNYIPTVKTEKYKDIISWIRKKCKKQGISLVGVSKFNLK